jgi:hypothetical protein
MERSHRPSRPFFCGKLRRVQVTLFSGIADDQCLEANSPAPPRSRIWIQDSACLLGPHLKRDLPVTSLKTTIFPASMQERSRPSAFHGRYASSDAVSDPGLSAH